MIHLQEQHKSRLVLALIIGGLILFFVLIRLWAVSGPPQDEPADSPEGMEVSEDKICETQRDRIEKKIASQNFKNKKAELQATFSVPELFYSPKTRSCLYVEMMTLFKNTAIDAIAYEIKDVVTDDVLFKEFIEWNDDFKARKDRFMQLVDSYKH